MKSISTIRLEDVIPLELLESVTGKELNCVELSNKEILTEHPGALQQALEFSSTWLMVDGLLKELPESLLPYRDTAEFSDRAMKYLNKNAKLKVPNEQKLFQIKDENDFSVCELQLADLVYEQWLIGDILLQSEAVLKPNNKLRAKHKGIGNGVFDLIINRIKEKASESGVKSICLMAYLPEHRKIFEKRGFELIPWPHLELSFKLGMSFPMIYKIKSPKRSKK